MSQRVCSTVLLAGLVACAPAPALAQAAAADSGVSVAAFGQLRWVEGRWRGEQPNGQPFFEAYRFENDSTIRSYTYADAASTVPTDSGAITLRGGQVTTGGGGARWAAAELTATRIRFAPVAGARNAFVWERTSADAWTATLSWPATAERPTREVVYPMSRLRP
jgi:hypothetical protein